MARRAAAATPLEKALLVVVSAGLVAALLNYLPLLQRAADASAALDAARQEELPSMYYTRHSAGFDDTLVSFSDDTEPQQEVALTKDTAAQHYEPRHEDRIDDEDRTLWQDVVA